MDLAIVHRAIAPSRTLRRSAMQHDVLRLRTLRKTWLVALP